MPRQNILITGASSGLGEGMARLWAARGHNLALCARRSGQLESLRDELQTRYPHIHVSVRALDVNRHDDVFAVFRAFREEFGTIDRIVVNAGLGKGAPIGTGGFRANLETMETNFVAALAQCEAAMEIFRDQNAGHLVTIASMAAMRGLPRAMTTYAATKAGLAALTEGIRADLIASRSAIKVSTIFPGFIQTALSGTAPKAPFMVDLDSGCRALVRAIEREPAEAYVPAWPWNLFGFLMKRLPLAVVTKMI